MDLFPIILNKKYGFININGDVIIKPHFKEVESFKDGLAWATIEKKDSCFSGYINTLGEWVIEPIYSEFKNRNESFYFSDGFAPIRNDKNKRGYVDTKGNFLTEFIFEEAYPFSEGLALVKKNGLYGYIDTLGNEIISCQFGKPWLFPMNYRFSQGLAVVKFLDEGEDKEDSLGYINTKGETYFDGQFIKAFAFSEGVACVSSFHSPGYYYYINQDGDAQFERMNIVASSFSEGVVSMFDRTNGRFGYLDKLGNWVIKPQFVLSGSFQNSLAFVKNEIEKYGLIDLEGKMVVDYKFEFANVFENGLALVRENGKQGYINTKGDYVWQGEK